MITKYEEFINEEFNFKETAAKALSKLDNFVSGLISNPVKKYIDRKVAGMSDEEKLIEIAKIARKIDKIFSVKNSIYSIIGGDFVLIMMQFTHFYDVKVNDHYLLWIILVAYNSMNKEFRKSAKSNYDKIREFYIRKYRKFNLEDDPFGEEDWFDKKGTEELNPVGKSDSIRFDGRDGFSPFERVPFIGIETRTRDAGPR